MSENGKSSYHDALSLIQYVAKSLNADSDLSDVERRLLSDNLHHAADIVHPTPIAQAIDANYSLQSRVKGTYPAIFRTYEMFVGTNQGDSRVYQHDLQVEGKSMSLRILCGDFQFWDMRIDPRDAGVQIQANLGSDALFTILHLRPTWKFVSTSYNEPKIARKRWRRLFTRSVAVSSRYFEIDYSHPRDFVRALTLGSSKREIRQIAIDTFFGLPILLDSYLDRKEGGVF